MANEVGKRYVCAVCGAELLVTKAGTGALSCCAQAMQLKVPAPPPPRDA